MKKKYVWLGVCLACALAAGCGKTEKTENIKHTEERESAVISWDKDATKIQLSDEEILVNGEVLKAEAQGTEKVAGVYAAHDIIFYLEGQDITYGEGEEWEAHSREEADAHTVVHITEPGTYEVSGSLSQGQIFVDLGEDAKKEEDAVVTLVLNDVDITCSVAPAVFFYQVYECGNDDPEEASADVDISGAGANVILADGTENRITGSHVAKIYESCELSEDGTEVLEAEKLHKYDAAFYSRRSMNIYGNTGVLNIAADNEGLDAEMHMAIHGGTINIYSGNDGINTNEDEVSVFAMHGGRLNIKVSGTTGEGDGIDSNGWLVVNGGVITASACGNSMDSGIDADMGIHLNGGTVIASGNMMDRIEAEGQTHISLMAREKLHGGKTYEVRDKDGTVIMEVTPENDFQMLVVSSEDLKADNSYSLWTGEEQVAESGDGMMGMPGGFNPGQMPEGFEPGQMPEGFEPGQMPEGFEPGQMPEGFDPEQMPEGFEPGQMPEGFDPEQMPKDFRPGQRPQERK